MAHANTEEGGLSGTVLFFIYRAVYACACELYG